MVSRRQLDAFRPRLNHARRKEQPDWERLLEFQIAHTEPKLPAPTRDYRFAKALGRRFEADFGWPHQHVLVEVQGGIWMRGRGAHSWPQHILRDIEKQQCALVLGYRLLPVTPEDVKSGHALDLIKQLLGARA